MAVPAVREECPSCREEFVNPRLLPCMHSLCYQCCSDMIRLGLLNSQPPFCPMCFEIIRVTTAKELPSNPVFKHNQLLEQQEQETKTQLREDSVAISLDIQENIKKTELVTLVIHDIVRDIDVALQGVQARKLVTRQDFAAEFKHFKSQTFLNEAEALELEHRQEALIAETEAILASDTKILELQRDQMGIFLDWTHTTIKQAQAMLLLLQTQFLHKNDFSILSQVLERLKHLQDIMKQREPLVHDTLRLYVPSRSVKNLPINELGILARIHPSINKISHPISVIRNKEGQFLCPRGITITKDGNLVVADTKRLQFLTIEGVFLRAIKTNSSFEYIASDKKAQLIWVSDKESQRLTCFSEDGTILQHISTPEPNGVLILPSGDICCCDSKNNVIRIYTQYGELKRTFPGPNEKPLSSPRGIGLLSTTEIVVANFRSSRVQVFTVEGSFVRTIGRNAIFNPDSITITHDNLIVVSEWSKDKISIWSSKGDFVHCFGSSGTNISQFRCPSGIAQLPNGRLAVADSNNHRIQVF